MKNNRKRKTAAFLGLLTAFSAGLSPIVAHAGNEVATGALDIGIRKSAEWVDETNGNASITLQYSSNSGTVEGTEDMDVVLIQDRSGSMDSEYGYHLYLQYYGRAEVSSSYQPIRNSVGYSESAATMASKENYLSGRMQGVTRIGEYKFNSPCQVEGHYYFLVNDTTVEGTVLNKGYFVPGSMLYNIIGTDLHHYVKLSGRDEALVYLGEGRRVIRAANYYDANETPVQLESEFAYFLDVSSICTVTGTTDKVLKVVDQGCTENDRLSKSQEFLTKLADLIYEKNENNAVSYIPFWCDVPEDADGDGEGEWKNWDSITGQQELVEVNAATANRYIDSVPGSYAVGFCGSDSRAAIEYQISQDFTYNGTNWTNAFKKAIEQIQKRRAEGVNRKTLILFLTDGVPQAFNGKTEDINNPNLNAENQIAQIRGMEDVTVYSCGVGISQTGSTNVLARLNSMDSSGSAATIRYTKDFGALYQTITDRINEQYVIRIQAKEMIYQDTLSEGFALDTSAVDDSLISVVEQASETMKNGVPENVYDLLAGGTKAVYVSGARTIYWYIGTATDGSYDAEGHSFSFPVTFRDYGKVMENTLYESNDEQKATYYSTASPDDLKTVTMEVPTLVFRREELPKITVTMDSKYVPVKDISRDIVIFHENQNDNSSAAEGFADAAVKETMVIPAGSQSTSFTSSGLKPGDYYIYFVNEDGTLDLSSEQKVTLTSQAEITTEEKSSGFPASRVTSDGTELDNHNNYLKITTKGVDASFQVEELPVADLTVEKIIDSGDENIWWAHGEPTFLIQVSGVGDDGRAFEYNHVYKFTKDYVDASTEDGKVSISYTFKNVPVTTDCKVQEVKVLRYSLEEVTGNGDNVTVCDGADEGMFSEYASVDIRQRPEGTEVDFYNVKERYDKLTHVTSVENVIMWE